MDDIQAMVAARDSLERYSDSANHFSNINSEYRKIYDLILEYIKTHCDHILTNDYIDTCPENSIKITYCQNCFSNY
jgi:hypothetical protein